MSRGSPANFLREQRPRLPSVRTASHFRGGRERAATFSGFPLPPSLFLVRVSYLNRRPFYGLRTRPPLPSFSPSFALTCLAAWADCSSLLEYVRGWHPLPLESAIRGLAAFETTRACHPVRLYDITCSQCAIFQGSAMSQVYNFLLPISSENIHL